MPSLPRSAALSDTGPDSDQMYFGFHGVATAAGVLDMQSLMSTDNTFMASRL